MRYAYLNVWRILTIAGIGIFLDFCEKQSKLLKKINQTTQGTTSHVPLTTFLRRTMRSVQVSKNVKK